MLVLTVTAVLLGGVVLGGVLYVECSVCAACSIKSLTHASEAIVVLSKKEKTPALYFNLIIHTHSTVATL